MKVRLYEVVRRCVEEGVHNGLLRVSNWDKPIKITDTKRPKAEEEIVEAIFEELFEFIEFFDGEPPYDQNVIRNDREN